MAESIIIHFRSASAQDVLRRIATMAGNSAEQESYPYCYPPDTAYLLLISVYEDYATEYEEDERVEMERMLEARPHGSLVFELRRSQSDAACDAAVEILRQLSAEFSFVVNDCYRFWRASEAISSSHFLDEYRYVKTAHQRLRNRRDAWPFSP
jgi:hypothetical protein